MQNFYVISFSVVTVFFSDCTLLKDAFAKSSYL